MKGNNPRQAVVDMATAIRDVAKEYSRDVRRKAWDKLCSSQGKTEMEKVLTNTSRPIARFRSLTFGEWLQHEEL